MKRFDRLVMLLGILMYGLHAHAQDQQYSQFFNAPIYLNPALNGQFNGDLRLNMIYRNQWSSLQNNPTYFTASIDYNVPRYGGSLGLMITKGSEGAAYLTKTNISGIYSYSVGSDGFILSFGLQAGLTNRTINWNNLVFSDEIDPRTGFDPSLITQAEIPAYNNKFYFDSGAGANLVAGNFMIGSAVQHLNSPNESFTGAKAILPMRITTYASYIIDMNGYGYLDDEKSYIIPSIVGYRQADQLSLSAGLQYKYNNINLGLWYRGNGAGESSAVVLSVIFDLPFNRNSEKIRFGVSHDAPLSRLNYSNTSGTTEGSLSYETTFPNSENNFEHRFNGRQAYDFY